MSKSRSPTPTHNLSSTNTPERTTSRPQLLDEPPAGARRGPLIVRLPSPPPHQPSEPQIAESSYRRRSSHLIRPAEESSEEPMAKRMRRDSPATRGRRDSHSSPESDSQDDMADNEMDISKVNRPEPTPLNAPPKKKRTRTLTTPHQSAVLHALLAQSRFPTTAMREEVGRSIGLSARKVQIWFQNQRQKARRPRSQSDIPSNRPPQYGPFPSALESASHVHGFEDRVIEHIHYSGQPHLETQAASADPPARLLGPGMPGAPVRYSPHGHRAVHSPPMSAPAAETHFSPSHGFLRGSSPYQYRSPRMHAILGGRPATSQPSGWRERDPSRTLPPLVSTRPSSSSYGRRIYSSGAHPYNTARPTFLPHRSASPEQRFAHLPPDSVGRPPLVNIPPPFTLQPAPQWDSTSYLPRPSSSSWSRPSSRSTRGRSTSPLALRRELLGSAAEASGSDTYYLAERTPHLHSSSPRSIPPASTPPSRSGRYDPIRATFIPYSTPSVSPTASPARASGAGGDSAERADRKSSPSREDR